MRKLFAPLLSCLLLAACSNPFGSSDSRITFLNATNVPLLFVAIDRNDAPFTDPSPILKVSDHPDRLLGPGEVRKFEVTGYARGEDLIIWLYPVRDQSGEARLEGTVTVTHAELRATGYQITLQQGAIDKLILLALE